MSISFSGKTLDGSLFPPEVQGSIQLSYSRFWPRHRHDELEMNLVEHGTARYLLADRVYDLCPGTVVWLFPGQYHTHTDASPGYRHWVVCCRRVLIERMQAWGEAVPPSDDEPEGSFCRVLSPPDAKVLSDLLYQVEQIPGEETTRFYTGLTYAFATAWSLFSRSPHGEGQVLHPAVRQVIALLRQPEGDQLTVDAMARRVGISVSHLSRLFREQTGFALPEFRNRERLRRFHRLMTENPTRSLLDAALESGFGSYVQFYRVFCQEMGVSPVAMYPVRVKPPNLLPRHRSRP
ncbi:MAG: helix-turn-helix transcriptional regulator [Fibrella sp.]|nr:helix-turn-helix transcriptional regulator [Armatimonadota bacterium]